MKKTVVFLMVFCLLVLCGCDYREIDRGYLVTAIGFGEENGIINIFIEALSSSDVSDQKSERIVLTGSGGDEDEAYNNLKATLVKPLYFEHLGTAIFENSTAPNMEILNKIQSVNLGIYLVKTDDVKTLFENETPNGVLGYDVITFIQTQEKQNRKKIKNQLYKTQKNQALLPTVNFIDGNLILTWAGEGK